jgi:hypothetical protein
LQVELELSILTKASIYEKAWSTPGGSEEGAVAASRTLDRARTREDLYFALLHQLLLFLMQIPNGRARFKLSAVITVIPAQLCWFFEDGPMVQEHSHFGISSSNVKTREVPCSAAAHGSRNRIQNHRCCFPAGHFFQARLIPIPFRTPPTEIDSNLRIPPRL